MLDFVKIKVIILKRNYMKLIETKNNVQLENKKIDNCFKIDKKF